MNIGERIRSIRLEKHMTQTDVATGKITRNMLSAIESDKARPSLDTLYHLADRLDVPISYLLSDEIDIDTHKKYEVISDVRELFKNKMFSECISMIDNLGIIDDELAYILAYSNFELGVSKAKFGSFLSAEKHLLLAEKYAALTIYDTSLIECRIPLYASFVKNVSAPLLDFDKESFGNTIKDSTDFDYYKYICNDFEYNYSNHLFQKHMNAKIKIRERKYYDAINTLHEIIESKGTYEYNAYLMYGVYSDLANCYRQILDFENAFKFSEKRISMIESFNS